MFERIYPGISLFYEYEMHQIQQMYGIYFNHHFHFPAQLDVGGFTLSDLLDKPWSQVSSLLPPVTCLQFLSRIGFSISTTRRFSSNVANSRSGAFRWSIFHARKSPYQCVHSVRIEIAKLILVGTRITYQATGDAWTMYILKLLPGTINTVRCIIQVLRPVHKTPL